MYYVTVMQSPAHHQMTLEEFLFSNFPVNNVITFNHTNTRTYAVDAISDRLKASVNAERLIRELREFNERTAELHSVERHTLYRSFKIPKSSGGFRKINAPEPQLMNALRDLKRIFEEKFGALYHTSAFAYIKGRSTISAVKRHQSNESKWFAKYDLHDFFGSTTKEYVEKMFSMIFPFSEVLAREDGLVQFRRAIDLAFLDGGLPQGTPISPLITNIMMIPVDHYLSNKLRDFEKQKFVYTRYADDFLISSRYDFKFREVEKLIVDALKSYDAPFSLNSKKTRYGSSAGSNWNLGVMLNKDNEITVGYKKKREFQKMLYSFLNDTKNGIAWSKEDVQMLDGYRSYYKMVEGETIDRIVAHVGSKFGVDAEATLKAALRA